ncbi:hypothetical protein Lfu02_07720 [Longispora fulva]|nr:hypothetical protein Lfu02_07720 [Longispora fulva]
MTKRGVAGRGDAGEAARAGPEIRCRRRPESSGIGDRAAHPPLRLLIASRDVTAFVPDARRDTWLRHHAVAAVEHAEILVSQGFRAYSSCGDNRHYVK